MFLKYEIDVNTGNGSYKDLETSLNNFNFTDNVSVLTLYAQFIIHQNLIVIHNGTEKVGAALIDNGALFSNPT